MFNCQCGMCFKSELGYKIHITRKCDCGRNLEIITAERMIAKPFHLFLKDVTIENNTYIDSDEDRLIRILINLKGKYQEDRELPFKIMNYNHTYLKGYLNLIQEKDGKNNNFVDYQFSKISTTDFFSLLIKSLNERLTKPIKLELNNIMVKYLVDNYLYK